MKKLSIVVIGLFLLTIFCKQPKEQELNDPDWRKESLDISYNICLKLESCVKDEFSKIKKDLQNYAKSEMKPEKCNEKTKKSRVYLLKGFDPVKIKQVVRSCYSHIQNISCEEIKSGSIKTNVSCEEMRRIQQGSSLN
jgi:hypothetical protein